MHHPQHYSELREAASKQTPAPDDETWLNANQVRARVGNVSNMCLWRWMRDERVRFPQPDLVLNNRRYWKAGTIRCWQSLRLIRHPLAV
jgi:hypothetical protein